MLLHGANGAGKTNLLEALHVGTQGFSPRSRRDGTMIRFDADAARVQLSGSLGHNAFATDVVLARHDARRIELNGERLSSGDRLRQELTTLVFTPDRLAVVKGGPATRRAYLDRAVGRLLPARAALANEYASAVGQRNAGLRRVRWGSSTRAALEPWTDKVVELGEALVLARLAAIELLAAPFARSAGELGLEAASLRYEGETPTANDLAARFDADLERGVTSLGPHLHDLRIEAGGETCGRSGRRASSGWQCWRSSSPRPPPSENARLSHRSCCSTTCCRSSTAIAVARWHTCSSAALQTVVTATAAAALPIEPAQALAVTPGQVR